MPAHANTGQGDAGDSSCCNSDRLRAAAANSSFEAGSVTATAMPLVVKAQRFPAAQPAGAAPRLAPKGNSPPRYLFFSSLLI
jgi:hypothetical protein